MCMKYLINRYNPVYQALANYAQPLPYCAMPALLSIMLASLTALCIHMHSILGNV